MSSCSIDPSTRTKSKGAAVNIQSSRVVDPQGDEPAASARIRELGPRPPGDGRGEVTIFTSGSTGAPKAVRHDWNTLTRPVRQGERATAQTCLLTYQPHLYAGIQVFMHCLINRATLVLPEPGMGVDDLIDLMRLRHVNFVSATPSYWRRLLTLGSHAKLRELAHGADHPRGRSLRSGAARWAQEGVSQSASRSSLCH